MSRGKKKVLNGCEKYVKYLLKIIDRFMILLMLILEIGLADQGKLNFDKSLVHFNVAVYRQKQ